MAVLTYGSTLRGESSAETLIDYYVVVDSLRDVPGSSLLAVAGTAVPPNVYYIEGNQGQRVVRAKYAVVAINVLRECVRATTRNPYFWARFSQPMALVYARDERERTAIVQCIALAIRTAYGYGLELAKPDHGAAVWSKLFAKTYQSELRPERAGRNISIVDANTVYYSELSALLSDVQPVRAWWPAILIKGKLLTVLRLIKAAYTFSGGADYVAWKIERHSGEKLALSDWQRRHPLLAGLLMLPKLLRKGVVR